MSLDIYHKLILALIYKIMLIGGFCVVYGLASSQPSRRVMLTCLVVIPFLSGCISIINAMCGIQHDVLFFLRGKALETMRLVDNRAYHFKALIGVFFILGFFFLYITAKITAMVFG
jgi:ABC-type spermidine/putrescine transport system permease subunit I